MLEPIGRVGYFQRLGFLQFERQSSSLAVAPVEPVEDLVRQHFISSEISSTICEKDDEESFYKVTLV